MDNLNPLIDVSTVQSLQSKEPRKGLPLARSRAEPAGADRLATRKALTRADLFDAVLRACPQLSRTEARAVLNMTLAEIGDELVGGVGVELRSFGVFYVRSKSQRVGRNPRTGEPAQITARRRISFRPSPKLISAVSEAMEKGS